MLVFPQWSSSQVLGEHCHTKQWHPTELFAPYIARPCEYIRHPQYEEEVSTGGSSPEHSDAKVDSGTSEEVVCEWQGCRTRCSGVTRLSAHLSRNHGHPHTDGLFYCRWKNCTRPQRGFNARYKMLVHVRTHTNERPHACPQCEKSFSRAENLKIHLRSHSGEKPYVCPYEGCGKAYSNSSDRFKHTRTHTIDKPYSCKVPNCNKRYTDPSSLRKHVKTYKHYRPKEAPLPDSSDDSLEKSAFSPVEPTYKLNTSPPATAAYSSSGVIVQPVTSTNYLGENVVRTNDLVFNRVYMPDEQIYRLRVPPYSYYQCLNVDYTRKYDQSYSHFRSGSYQARPEEIVYDTNTEIETEEMPLNLKYDRSIEDMVKRDMPLDLSTKS